MQLLTSQKNFLVLSICIPKRINGIISEVQLWKRFLFLVLTLGKFLEALGSRIGTGSIFCLSFSLSNRVTWVSLSLYLWHHWWSELYLSLCVGVGSLKFMHTLTNRHPQKSKLFSERVFPFTSNRRKYFTLTFKFKNIRKDQFLLIFIGGGVSKNLRYLLT